MTDTNTRLDGWNMDANSGWTGQSTAGANWGDMAVVEALQEAVHQMVVEDNANQMDAGRGRRGRGRGFRGRGRGGGARDGPREPREPREPRDGPREPREPREHKPREEGQSDGNGRGRGGYRGGNANGRPPRARGNARGRGAPGNDST
jgi:hypothetical protein